MIPLSKRSTSVEDPTPADGELDAMSATVAAAMLDLEVRGIVVRTRRSDGRIRR